MTDEFGTTTTTNGESRIRQASEAIRDMANDLKPAVEGVEPVLRRITDELYRMPAKRHSNHSQWRSCWA
jgi:hypothetical protein